jgi:uncharacterized protein
MKSILRIGLALFLSFAGLSAGAAQFPAKPDKTHFYVDQAGLLKPEDAQVVDRVAAALLKEEKIPIIAVTIPSLITYQAGNLAIEPYARQLFDHWGLGFKDRNFGILLLVSLGDRKARIELGKGWAGEHDGDAQYIMDELMVPAFRAGDYSGGIRQGVEALDKMARGLGLPKPKTPWWAPVLFFGGIMLMVGVIVSLFKSGRSGWGWALIAGLGVMLFFMLRSSMRSGGSGGSFGGGFSGGGGASGSW